MRHLIQLENSDDPYEEQIKDVMSVFEDALSSSVCHSAILQAFKETLKEPPKVSSAILRKMLTALNNVVNVCRSDSTNLAAWDNAAVAAEKFLTEFGQLTIYKQYFDAPLTKILKDIVNYSTEIGSEKARYFIYVLTGNLSYFRMLKVPVPEILNVLLAMKEQVSKGDWVNAKSCANHLLRCSPQLNSTCEITLKKLVRHLIQLKNSDDPYKEQIKDVMSVFENALLSSVCHSAILRAFKETLEEPPRPPLIVVDSTPMPVLVSRPCFFVAPRPRPRPTEELLNEIIADIDSENNASAVDTLLSKRAETLTSEDLEVIITKISESQIPSKPKGKMIARIAELKQRLLQINLSQNNGAQ